MSEFLLQKMYTFHVNDTISIFNKKVAVTGRQLGLQLSLPPAADFSVRTKRKTSNIILLVHQEKKQKFSKPPS